ncbi:hypothetical protein EOA27_23865, partial [Mesorhizobium sp. M2A.F.Ca.ET.037.01.1.1]
MTFLADQRLDSVMTTKPRGRIIAGARPDQTLQVTITGKITDISKAVAAIKANPDVGKIVIEIDSAGGSISESGNLFNALLE